MPNALNVRFQPGLQMANTDGDTLQSIVNTVNGLLLPGNSWFVNEAAVNASDTNSGNDANPFKTLDAALLAATASNNDVVYLIGTQHRTTTLAWNKNGVHLVGLTAPSDNDRARISVSGTTPFTPLVNVTGVGCMFLNLGTFHGFNNASAQVCWNEAGGRNYYSNVQFLGGGDATAAAHAGMRSLTVTGGGENYFEDCTIGLDTITRATGNNASLEFLSGTPRNRFERCLFQALVSNAADLHVLVGVDGIDRYVLFKDCTFINCIAGGPGATTMTVAFTVNASAGGAVILKNCTSLGATVYATAGPIYVDGAVPTGNSSGLAVAAT